MDRTPRIEVLDDAEALADRACALFVSAAHEAIAARGSFRVAIPGGHTPRRFFALLAGNPKAVDWSRIHVFWTDERYVRPDHPDSNYGLAAGTFLKAVQIPESNVHRVRTEARTPCDAAREYEQSLLQVFGGRPGTVPSFDLVVLGLGTDGHTASLFPYSFAAVDAEHLAGLVSRPEGPARVTLMGPVLRAARRILILVSGLDKAEILNRVFTSEPDPLQYPIHALWPVLDHVLWLADREALAQTPETWQD